MANTIGQAIMDGAQVLRKAGVPEARREAGSLLAHVSGHDRTFLISHVDASLTEEVLIRFRENIDRRSSGEPLQYITGIQDFFGRQFRVTPDVLIPRPETELVVEAALQLIDSQDPAVICDVGTGSGCIAVTLLCERACARAVAVDISAKAIGVARQNAVDQSVDERILFAVSDCFNSLPNGEQIFDLIVSNPPYVSAAALPGLQREVRDHEPLAALTPGPDGLTMIGRLIQEAPDFLKPEGHMILEIGFDQGEAVENLIDSNRWHLIEIRPDLQGIPRIVVLQRVG
jgi:release factor glutamine methyltransferase